jgi:hypothetical protein
MDRILASAARSLTDQFRTCAPRSGRSAADRKAVIDLGAKILRQMVYWPCESLNKNRGCDCRP